MKTTSRQPVMFTTAPCAKTNTVAALSIVIIWGKIAKANLILLTRLLLY